MRHRNGGKGNLFRLGSSEMERGKEAIQKGAGRDLLSGQGKKKCFCRGKNNQIKKGRGTINYRGGGERTSLPFVLEGT